MNHSLPKGWFNGIKYSLYFTIAINVVSWCLFLVVRRLCTSVWWLSLVLFLRFIHFTIWSFIWIYTSWIITRSLLIFLDLFHFNYRIFFVFSRGFLIASLSIKFWIINSVLLFLLSCLWLFSWWCCSFKWELNPPWFFICLVYWHWFICCVGNILIWHRSLGYSLCSVSLSLGSMFIL